MVKERVTVIKVGIVGGTGYTGVELLRILAVHPAVEIQVITSRAESGRRVSECYPNLRGHVELTFEPPDIEVLSACELVFFATPNGVAMHQVPALLERGVRVIDLAADFRLKSAQLWSRGNGMEHAGENLLEEAVYGLPEVNRAEIRSARLVANPGCYPTAVQLGWLPLLEGGLLESGPLIADCKSGVSGAGRAANEATLLCECSESFKAYGVVGHRHLPEIEQGLNHVCARAGQGAPGQLTFVPHLVPMIRGIHATLYATVRDHACNLQQLYEDYYKDEPFVDVMPANSCPETRSVRGANVCRIAVSRPGNGDRVLVLSVIDNLVKGASGQAVQNMNIMMGLPETLGLEGIALLP
jgi:N-acetyl-gamma-glutamyl-phosphate reductase